MIDASDSSAFKERGRGAGGWAGPERERLTVKSGGKTQARVCGQPRLEPHRT